MKRKNIKLEILNKENEELIWENFTHNKGLLIILDAIDNVSHLDKIKAIN